MKVYLIPVLGILFMLSLQAQEIRFEVSTSSDTLLEGHLLQVTYFVENADVSGFIAPDFKGLTLVNGPQHTSSMQSINGRVRREASLSYLFVAEHAGTISLEPAQLVTKEKNIATRRLSIVVLPNPGEKPDPRFPGWRPLQKDPAPQDSIQEILRRGRKSYRL